MSQGFSTLYDLKMLNSALLVAGEVFDEAYPFAVTVDSVESGE